MLRWKRYRTFILGMALISIIAIMAVTVFSKQTTESIEVIYDNIKILIDGIEYTCSDANGNVIEPFVFNGTTYLPVRAIANAFDKDVSWEPQTSTVILGSKKYNWLDQIGYANYETSGNKNQLTAWEYGQKASDGIKYSRGIEFSLGYSSNDGAKENLNGSLESYQNVEYLLNNNYKSFEGIVACCSSGSNNQNAIIKIYGDGNLLYTSSSLTKGSQPTNFKIDISEFKVIKINASIPNIIKNSYNKSLIGIIEARLAKK